MRTVRNSCFKVCSCKVKLLTGNRKTDQGLYQVWRLVPHPKSFNSTLKHMVLGNPMSWQSKSMERELAFPRSKKVTFMQYALLKCCFLNQCPGSWLCVYHVPCTTITMQEKSSNKDRQLYRQGISSNEEIKMSVISRQRDWKVTSWG